LTSYFRKQLFGAFVYNYWLWILILGHDWKEKGKSRKGLQNPGRERSSAEEA
jgi:hypothetical protein